MILKKFTEEKVEVGDYKVLVKFAYLPKRVGNNLIWLEYYKQIYEYRIRDRSIFLHGIVYTIKNCPDWDLIAEK